MLPIFQSSYFQDILESFPNGIAIFNTDGEVYACNAEADVVLHIGGEGCTGRHWRDLLAGVVEKEELQRFVDEVLDERLCRLPLEVRYERMDGRTARLSLTAGILSEYGKVFGVVLSITDVSHIYTLHERETRMLNELNALHQQRADHLRKLAMAVAHQIRNPVMTVGGFARLLLKKAEEGEKEFLEGILESSKRLESIVNAVSEFTSIEAGAREKLEVKPLLEEVRDQALAGAGLKPADLEFEIHSGIVRLTADPALLRDALKELAQNAVEALAETLANNSAEGGEKPPRVSLRASLAADGRREFRVEDNGHGIPEAEQQFIFDPFYTTKAVGVGMGLTKARRMAGELGGELTVESRPGKGTTAVLLLPPEE